MKNFLLLLLPLIALSCAETKYAMKYSFNLKCEINGESSDYNLDRDHALYYYADSILSVEWHVSDTRLSFTLVNESNSSFKIVWDDVVYVDETGRAGKVAHKNIRYMDQAKTQPDSHVPKGTKLEDIIIPIDNLYFSDQYGVGVEALNGKSLLPESVKKQDIEPLKSLLIGRYLKVIMPIIYNNNRYEYTFLFKIIDINIRA